MMSRATIQQQGTKSLARLGMLASVAIGGNPHDVKYHALAAGVLQEVTSLRLMRGGPRAPESVKEKVRRLQAESRSSESRAKRIEREGLERKYKAQAQRPGTPLHDFVVDERKRRNNSRSRSATEGAEPVLPTKLVREYKKQIHALTEELAAVKEANMRAADKQAMHNARFNKYVADRLLFESLTSHASDKMLDGFLKKYGAADTKEQYKGIKRFNKKMIKKLGLEERLSREMKTSDTIQRLLSHEIPQNASQQAHLAPSRKNRRNKDIREPSRQTVAALGPARSRLSAQQKRPSGAGVIPQPPSHIPSHGTKVSGAGLNARQQMLREMANVPRDLVEPRFPTIEGLRQHLPHA